MRSQQEKVSEKAEKTTAEDEERVRIVPRSDLSSSNG